MRAPLCAALGAALALSPSPARAEDEGRLDHRGAVGLSLAPGWEHPAYLPLTRAAAFNDANFVSLELTCSLGLNARGNELTFTARGLRGPVWAAALGADWRWYAGREHWKTFVDLGLKADTAPGFVVGPHADVGVMYDFTALLGIFAKVGGSLELGQGLRGAFEANLGVQGRSYLLE